MIVTLNLTSTLRVIVKFIKILAISTPKVGFYTVALGSSELTEFEKFVAKDLSAHKEELQKLYTVIDQMGLSGAKPYYFKSEGGFEYLPKISSKAIALADNEDYGIRLYCVHISPRIVVLFNGGIKTNLDPDLCENVKTHFSQARKIARKISYGLKEEFITYVGNSLLFDESYEIDI